MTRNMKLALETFKANKKLYDDGFIAFSPEGVHVTSEKMGEIVNGLKVDYRVKDFDKSDPVYPFMVVVLYKRVEFYCIGTKDEFEKGGIKIS